MNSLSAYDGHLLHMALSLDLTKLENIDDLQDTHAAFDVLLVSDYEQACILVQVSMVQNAVVKIILCKIDRLPIGRVNHKHNNMRVLHVEVPKMFRVISVH